MFDRAGRATEWHSRVGLTVLFAMGFCLAGCATSTLPPSSPRQPPGLGEPVPALDPRLAAKAGAVVVARYEGQLDPGDIHGRSPERFHVVASLKGDVDSIAFVTSPGVPLYRGFAPRLDEGRSYLVYVAEGEATDNLVLRRGPAPGLAPFASQVLAILYADESQDEKVERTAAEDSWAQLERCDFDAEEWVRARSSGGLAAKDMTCAVRWLQLFLLQHQDRPVILGTLGDPDRRGEDENGVRETYVLNGATRVQPEAGAFVGSLEVRYISGCRDHLVTDSHGFTFEVFENGAFVRANAEQLQARSIRAGTSYRCITECDDGERRGCDDLLE